MKVLHTIILLLRCVAYSMHANEVMDDSGSDSGYVTPPTQVVRQIPIQPPPRPRRLFDVNASPRSSPSVGTSVTMEGNADKGELTVLTWNVWFDYHKQSVRYAAIVSSVLTLDPDVACFQEVTRPFINTLKSNKELIKRYHISSNPIYDYGVLSIAKRDIGKISFEEMELPSNMGRSLLMTHIHIPRMVAGRNEHVRGGDRETRHLVVGNVHLESLDNEPLRRQQLILSSERLSKEAHSGSILVGDFNFDSERTWGDWNRPTSLHRPKHELENVVLKEVMPEWNDSWPYLKGIGEGADPGITFDGLNNPICVRNEQERMRYDRIMVHMPNEEGRFFGHLVPSDIEMVGVDPIDETGLRPSDHYGLWITLKIDYSSVIEKVQVSRHGDKEG